MSNSHDVRWVVRAGNATVGPDVSALKVGPRFAALVTDPPYCLLTRRRRGGDLRDPKGRKVESGPLLRFETVRDYRSFTAQWVQGVLPLLDTSAPLVVWTNFLGRDAILTVAREYGYSHLWGEYAWAKRTRPPGGGEQLLRVYEVALVLGRNVQRRLGLAERARVWTTAAGYDDNGEAARWGSHPSHKPFGVLEPLIREYVPPQAWLLDPFAGSGSIGAAALRLGRRAAMLEIDPVWVDCCRGRLGAIGEVASSAADLPR